ncbi:MAG: type II toxin-antitoxin system Phd/YefM family antitoxin [Nocardioidaceae bacterium]
MDEVSVRDLRNRSREVLERVGRGKTLIVTNAGAPVAELRPLPRKRLAASELVARRRHLPAVELAEFRADIDAVVDASI